MKRETIKLDDFLKEFTEAFNVETGALTPENKFRYKCPKCSRTYSEETKFCPEDGAEIEKEEYEVRNSEFKDFAFNTICGLEEWSMDDQYKDYFDKFPYEYVDTLDKKADDASGRWYLYVFKRKSDGKYFYYGIYEGRIEEYTLDECQKKEVVVWDFESMFA